MNGTSFLHLMRMIVCGLAVFVVLIDVVVVVVIEFRTTNRFGFCILFEIKLAMQFCHISFVEWKVPCHNVRSRLEYLK